MNEFPPTYDDGEILGMENDQQPSLILDDTDDSASNNSIND